MKMCNILNVHLKLLLIPYHGIVNWRIHFNLGRDIEYSLLCIIQFTELEGQTKRSRF